MDCWLVCYPNSELGIKHITSIDIDPKCKEIVTQQ